MSKQKFYDRQPVTVHGEIGWIELRDAEGPFDHWVYMPSKGCVSSYADKNVRPLKNDPIHRLHERIEGLEANSPAFDAQRAVRHLNDELTRVQGRLHATIVGLHERIKKLEPDHCLCDDCVTPDNMDERIERSNAWYFPEPAPAGYTPGPWLIADTDSGFIVTDQEGRSVAAVHYQQPGNAANARLIAAAPDMLAALKMLKSDRASGKVAEACRAAIAKAEGKG